MLYKVKKEMSLRDFLLELGYKPGNVKKLLKYHQVKVDGKIQSDYNYHLKVGQSVEINTNKQKSPLPIIYEDHDIIVIDKPAGMLSVATDREKYKTAYSLMQDYVKRKNERLYIVHRLDQETSGILMFSKKKELSQALTHHWNECVTKREYIALVEGEMKQQQGTIKNYLREAKNQQVYVSNRQQGKLAITHYQVLKTNHRYSLLKVNLETGRKNQIRVHLASIHHPIVGDKKYGAKSDPIKRLGLHHEAFALVHPINHQSYEFKSPLPASFNQVFNRQ